MDISHRADIIYLGLNGLTPWEIHEDMMVIQHDEQVGCWIQTWHGESGRQPPSASSPPPPPPKPHIHWTCCSRSDWFSYTINIHTWFLFTSLVNRDVSWGHVLLFTFRSCFRAKLWYKNRKCIVLGDAFTQSLCTFHRHRNKRKRVLEITKMYYFKNSNYKIIEQEMNKIAIACYFQTS